MNKETIEKIRTNQEEQKKRIIYWKKHCFETIENLTTLLEENYNTFKNMLDSQSLRTNKKQFNKLSSVMPLETFDDFTEFLYLKCEKAGKMKKHKYGGYSYIIYNNRIYFLNVMDGEIRIIQFGLVSSIPEEDNDFVPFNIKEYGLDSLEDLIYNGEINKAINNICYKYGIKVTINKNLDPEEYYVTEHCVTHNMNDENDAHALKRICLLYLSHGFAMAQKPIFCELSYRLKAWEKAIQNMTYDGFHYSNKSKDRIFLKDSIVKVFINQDVMTFIRRSNGLFEIPKKNVKIEKGHGAVHVEAIE